MAKKNGSRILKSVLKPQTNFENPKCSRRYEKRIHKTRNKTDEYQKESSRKREQRRASSRPAPSRNQKNDKQQFIRGWTEDEHEEREKKYESETNPNNKQNKKKFCILSCQMRVLNRKRKISNVLQDVRETLIT